VVIGSVHQQFGPALGTRRGVVEADAAHTAVSHPSRRDDLPPDAPIVSIAG
jgi:hypothetical protein